MGTDERTKWERSLVVYVLDGIPVAAAVGFAAFVLYRREMLGMPTSTEDLLASVLAVLGLLAISEITERYGQLRHIRKSVERSAHLLESRVQERPSALAFFQKSADTDYLFQTSESIWLCGVSMTSTINQQSGNLRERLRSGADIRILVEDAASDAPKMSGARHEQDNTVFHRSQIQSTLYVAGAIQKAKLKSDISGSISVRLLDYAPSFGIAAFDCRKAHGTILVWLYVHKFGGRRLMFTLNAGRDGEWYSFFVEQFETMWGNAKECRL